MHGDGHDLDVLIIGAGIAGLSTAIALAGRRHVAVMAREDGGGSTLLAQGGIAAALGAGDSPAAHAADTVAAAAGLGDPDVAGAVAGEAADAVAMLARLGVHFDGGALAREGGHSVARVAHARGDATGAEISHALMGAARDLGVPVMAGAFLVDLLMAPDGARVVGALVWDARLRVLRPVRATTVVLATGGYGQLWANTTSPPACSGDGLAAAMRAGAQVADLEFVQFHPTGMALGRDPRPLATEALRGAGARLRDATGRYLHARPEDDLAPRDVVSRDMARRMVELGADHCYLDATGVGPEVLAQHYPTFVATCRTAALAPGSQWVPVAPTVHYTMGGALTDTEGRTTLEGLMAVGEVGCTGLHGANRLASNSLLEGAVVGRRAAQALMAGQGPSAPRSAVTLDAVLAPVPAPVPAPAASGEGRRAGPAELRAAMQEGAGVARDAEGLGRLADYLADVAGPTELATMRLIATAVVGMARRRRESRGAHWRTDYPTPCPDWRLRQVVQLLPGGEIAVGELEVQPQRQPVAGPAAASV